jgi:hypothetical protein
MAYLHPQQQHAGIYHISYVIYVIMNDSLWMYVCTYGNALAYTSWPTVKAREVCVSSKLDYLATHHWQKHCHTGRREAAQTLQTVWSIAAKKHHLMRVCSCNGTSNAPLGPTRAQPHGLDHKRPLLPRASTTQ